MLMFTLDLQHLAERAAQDAALINRLEEVLRAQGKTPPTDIVLLIADMAGHTTCSASDMIGRLLAVALRGEPMPWESVGQS